MKLNILHVLQSVICTNHFHRIKNLMKICKSFNHMWFVTNVFVQTQVFEFIQKCSNVWYYCTASKRKTSDFKSIREQASLINIRLIFRFNSISGFNVCMYCIECSIISVIILQMTFNLITTTLIICSIINYLIISNHGINSLISRES